MASKKDLGKKIVSLYSDKNSTVVDPYYFYMPINVEMKALVSENGYLTIEYPDGKTFTFQSYDREKTGEVLIEKTVKKITLDFDLYISKYTCTILCDDGSGKELRWIARPSTKEEITSIRPYDISMLGLKEDDTLPEESGEVSILGLEKLREMELETDDTEEM